MEFHEIQTIQCPTRQSFDAHREIWDDIEVIAKEHNCVFKWEVLSKEERTYRLNVKGNSKTEQMNGLMKVIEFLNKQDIEPALILDSEDLKRTKKSIKKAIEICEEVV